MPKPNRSLTEATRRSIAAVGVRETARRAGVDTSQVVRIADGDSVASHALTTAAILLELASTNPPQPERAA